MWVTEREGVWVRGVSEWVSEWVWRKKYNCDKCLWWGEGLMKRLNEWYEVSEWVSEWVSDEWWGNWMMGELVNEWF